VVATFPAFSVRQPYADLIVDGIKDIENRSRWSRFRGNILVHAAKTPWWDHVEYRRRDLEIASADDYDGYTSAIIGIVEVVDVVERHRSRWFDEGSVGLVLRNARRFRRPIPYKGALGIFHVPIRLLRGTTAARQKPGELSGIAIVATGR
jgi:hypothetical protein